MCELVYIVPNSIRINPCSKNYKRRTVFSNKHAQTSTYIQFSHTYIDTQVYARLRKRTQTRMHTHASALKHAHTHTGTFTHTYTHGHSSTHHRHKHTHMLSSIIPLTR